MELETNLGFEALTSNQFLKFCKSKTMGKIYLGINYKIFWKFLVSNIFSTLKGFISNIIFNFKVYEV